jgi:DNA-binding beta-propeller fold protein YncE
MPRKLVVAMALLGMGLGTVMPAGLYASSAASIRMVRRVIYGGGAIDLFNRPSGMAVDRERGIIMIADTGNRRVVVFDDRGRCRGSISLVSDRLTAPAALSLDSRDNIFLVDALKPDIDVMTSRGSLIREFRPNLPPGCGKVAARDIAIAASGRIYILFGGDTPGIVVLEADGRPAWSIGLGSGDPELFKNPEALAVNADETLIAVADPLADRAIVVLDGSGAFQFAFGEHTEAPDGFSLANDVTWGPQGTLWVTDTLRHDISVFDSRGNHLGLIGGYGTSPGQFLYPVASEFLAGDRLLVLERAGARFQVLEVNIPVLDSTREYLERTGSASAEALFPKRP